MGKIFYRLTNSTEGKLFENTQLYDNIVINGKISIAQKTWMGTLLNKTKKGVYIDPQTFVYAINENSFMNGEEIKKSEEKYLDFFPENIKNILTVEKRTLEIDDFKDQNQWNDDFMKDFCKKIISIEKFHFRQNQLTAFLELIDEVDEDEEKTTLLAIIPPYFYFETPEDEWYEISLYLAQKTKNLEKDHEVHPVLCFNKETLLNEQSINRLLDDYAEFGTILIHISDFDESKIPMNYLEGFYNFLKKTNERNLTVINLYGNYFSFIMTIKNLLYGFSRGICYGNSKDVFATGSGGGGMQKRYYFELSTTKLIESKARTLLSHHPEYKCHCEVCSSKEGNNLDDFFNNMQNYDIRKHFMQKINEIRNKTINEIKQTLIANAAEIENKQLRNFGILPNHLKNWIKILEE